MGLRPSGPPLWRSVLAHACYTACPGLPGSGGWGTLHPDIVMTSLCASGSAWGMVRCLFSIPLLADVPYQTLCATHRHVFQQQWSREGRGRGGEKPVQEKGDSSGVHLTSSPVLQPFSCHPLLQSTWVSTPSLICVHSGCNRERPVGPDLRNGDDEDDREAQEHHQPAGGLHAGW